MKPLNNQKRFTALVCVVMMIFFMASSMSHVGAEGENPSSGILFSDISGSKAQDAIIQVASNNILHGYADGTFRPDKVMSRAEFTTAIERLLNEYPELMEKETFNLGALLNNSRFYPAKLPYDDVRQGQWMYSSVLHMNQWIDLLNGKGSFAAIFTGAHFYPNQSILLQEATQLLNSLFVEPLDEIASNKQPLTRGDAALLFDKALTKLDQYQLLPSFGLPTEPSFYSPPMTEEGNNAQLTFAEYEPNLLNDEDRRYLNIVDQIANQSVDKQALIDLRKLLESGYANQIGVNFYLVYLDDTMGIEEKVRRLTDLLDKLVSRASTRFYEIQAVLDEMDYVSLQADQYGKSIDFSSSLTAAYQLAQSSHKEWVSLFLERLALMDVQAKHWDSALSRYKELATLTNNESSLIHLAQIFNVTKKWDEGIQTFDSIKNSLKKADETNLPLIENIMADLKSTANQEKAVQLLETAYDRQNQQKGAAYRQILVEDDWFGLFQQKVDAANQLSYSLGQYYFSNSLTPKKYEEYQQIKAGQRTTYFFTSDENKWQLNKHENELPSLEELVNRVSYTDRLNTWNARYVLKETDTHYVIYEYIPGEALVDAFKKDKFNQGQLTTVDQFNQRYDIDKATMLPDRESWSLNYQFSDSPTSVQRLGSTFIEGYGSQKINIPKSVIDKATSAK